MSGMTAKRGECQPPVHVEQNDHEKDEQECVVDHGDDAGREQIVERVDVGGDARDQAADGASVVKAHGQALQARQRFLCAGRTWFPGRPFASRALANIGSRSRKASARQESGRRSSPDPRMPAGKCEVPRDDGNNIPIHGDLEEPGQAELPAASREA